MMSILTTVKSCLKTAGAFAKANSPVICTGMALVGLAATVVSVVKATKKCTKLVEKATEEKGAPLTTKETVKVCWKTCVAAIIAVAITGAAIVSALAFLVGLVASYYMATPTGATVVIANLIVFIFATFFEKISKQN
jgi:hypothetical protein